MTIPFSEVDERGALSCVLLAGIESQPEVDELLSQLKPSLFWDSRHQVILDAMRTLRNQRHAVDLVTVSRTLMNRNGEAKGALEVLPGLLEVAPSWANFPSYLEELQRQALRRWTLEKRERLTNLAMQPNLSLDTLRDEFGDLAEKADRIGRPRRTQIQAVSDQELAAYTPVESLGLVGDTDVQKGYQGITVIAGPPGSGKSLVAVSLAIAGAIGSGFWMGRKVHRQFRTLIVQCENGAMRLKREVEARGRHHPGVDFGNWIRTTLPPEGGLPFHRPEFRRELSRLVEDWQPDVIVVDPWTAVAVEDQAKDIVDKLAEIRSMLPAGDACPALCIVAHTKKPRPEDKANRGRALMFSVSGSQALVSTARCVYVLLPFTDDIQDDRVLWACAKLSDSEAPPADSVWHRRLGTLFAHCYDNPADYWAEDKGNDQQWLNLDMVRDSLGDAMMTRSRLVERLCDQHNGGKGASTVYRLLARKPYLDHLKSEGRMVSWQD